MYGFIIIWFNIYLPKSRFIEKLHISLGSRWLCAKEEHEMKPVVEKVHGGTLGLSFAWIIRMEIIYKIQIISQMNDSSFIMQYSRHGRGFLKGLLFTFCKVYFNAIAK